MLKFSSEEQIRIDIISKYIAGDIFLEDALAVLDIKERQFRRRVRAFRETGLLSIKHGNSGRVPANKTTQEDKERIIGIYRTKYYDLNLSHFREKLIENKEISHIPSYSTLRNLLLKAGIISPLKKRKKRAYCLRKRYAKEGLMVQIDGSHHHWIHRHRPICLTAAIDDATGKLLAGKFTPTETTFAAMDVVEDVIQKNGTFQMLYSDKAGIYGGGKRQGYSNMDRAMREVGIICVQAHSPQAKGRVERLFGTLQSRLVAELRLNQVKTIDQANKFLNEVFISSYNKKFAKEPTEKTSAFKPLSDNIDLKEVMCFKDTRIVQNGNVISYNSKLLSVDSQECLNKKMVEVRTYRNGEVKFFLEDDELKIIDHSQEKSAA